MMESLPVMISSIHGRHDMFACLFYRESPGYRIVSAEGS